MHNHILLHQHHDSTMISQIYKISCYYWFDIAAVSEQSICNCIVGLATISLIYKSKSSIRDYAVYGSLLILNWLCTL